MSWLQRRIAVINGVPTLAACGVPVAEALRGLEAGEPPAEVVDGFPLDLVAAVCVVGLGDDDSLGLKLVQAPPERSGLLASASEPALAGLWPRAPRPARLAVAAGLLQILDFWEESHEAAQEADDLGERKVSAYWHGIAHRREPDPGNASYWFRRVGPHPLFPALAQAASAVVDAAGGLGREVVANGWDPFAMIELCSRAGRGTDRERLARRLQRIEMALLLEATVAGVAGGPSVD